MKKTLKKCVKITIPVMTGYIFLGTSYGLLSVKSGIPPIISLLMSLLVYAGSMQFAAVEVLNSPLNPLGAFMLTLMVNARHVFYGISMLEKYQKLKKGKFYTIFALTDETFSIVSSLDLSKEEKPEETYFIISLLDQVYWILGTLIGVFLGKMISFNTDGIDFVLTALFATIFFDQWLENSDHFPALTGLISGIISLIIFGPNKFLIPAMLMIIGIFFVNYRRAKDD